MRKRIVPHRRIPQAADAQWLDLTMVTAEISSEDAQHPIQCALLDDDEGGWRAAGPGIQSLRILFDQPQTLRRIHLAFAEASIARTQEFVLRWSDGGETLTEIVRQQWNFSPEGAVSETENYDVQLANVRLLELTLNPDIGGSEARASLAKLRLA
jgi:hypothetical protein